MNVTATLIGQAIVFTILIWFIKSTLWEPIIGALEDRQKRIADGLAAAEKGQQQQELAEQGATEKLKEAKAEGAIIIAKAQERATAIVEEAKGAAVEEADRVKVGAQAELDQEVNRAKEGLRKQVSALALSGASTILGKEIDASAHKNVLDDLVSQL
jgi:F-type H+-transporting ATPase subunit b